jgi:hypothetical protein
VESAGEEFPNLSALADLRAALAHWSRPAQAHRVRLPWPQQVREQLRAVGWLVFYLGRPVDGLALVDAASGREPDLLRRAARAAIDGLLAGDRRPALVLDHTLFVRNREARPPHDLSLAGQNSALHNLARGEFGRTPGEQLLLSETLDRAIRGELAGAAGLAPARVQAVAEAHLAEVGQKPVRSAEEADPDGDGLTVGELLRTLAEQAGRPWRTVRRRPSKALESWTFGDWQGTPIRTYARSWAWVLATNDGLDCPLPYGIRRLLPVAELHPFSELPYYQRVSGPEKAALGDSVVIGTGPGRLLVLPITAGPDIPFTGDCPVWIFDEASETVVHRAESTWRYLRTAAG